ncbi:hypothetical protein [Changchengzhania lutea]|uniref:hypothetical protein n=1 Tax=Changchengzhania lutea TaxID=2049305 RepID=UPI00163DD24E|nr:hypothetical protein [Changchengzhania lutea]
MLLLISCNSDDDLALVGSTANYPTPTFSLRPGPTSVNEAGETVITYDIVTDRLTNTDLIFSFKQVGGNAELGSDYEVSVGTVEALTTTGEMSVTILNDVLVENTETLVLEIESGPAATSAYLVNPNTEYPSPLTINIENSVGFDLTIGMEWDADNGSESSPTELADLILLVTDAVSPYTNIIDGADGADFEELTLGADTPDGDYFVVADVYALDDSDFDIDIDLSFNQPGVIDDVLNFSAALNSRILCNNYVVLAKVSKSGESWSITSENATLTNDGSPDTSMAGPFIGTSTVVTDDWADYAVGDTVEIEAGTSANEFWIRNYTNPAIANTDTAYLIVTIDDVCGNVTVMSNEDYQYGCPTGVVTGSGTLDLASKTIDITNTFALGEACGGDYPGQQFVLQLP